MSFTILLEHQVCEFQWFATLRVNRDLTEYCRVAIASQSEYEGVTISQRYGSIYRHLRFRSAVAA